MKTKKIIALLLTLAVTIASFSLLGVSVSAVDVQTQIKIPEPTDPEVEEETYELDGVEYIVVRSADQMNELATKYSTGGKNYILAADLDYTGKDYKQIGFAKLNGNGHSIIGVHFEGDQSYGNNIAMFLTSGSPVEISNLTIGAPDNRVSVTATTTAWATNGSCRAGTIYGYIQGALTLENVNVYSDVTAPADYRTGGFVGETRGVLTIKNCVFDGSVTVGTKNATNNSICAGGLVGLSYGNGSDPVLVQDCANYGTISYPDGFAGGLFGGSGRGTNNHVTFTNCANYGSVSGNYAGGVDGDAGTSQWSNLVMNNCFNAGKVTGTTGAAGVVCSVARRNDYPAQLINCANIGEVDSAKKADLACNIVNASYLTITNCGSFGTGTLAITNKAAADASATDTAVDAAAALKFMQDNFKFAMFAIEGGKIVVKTVPVEARFIQYAKDTENGKMDIRVIGVIHEADLSKYADVGFNVSVYKTGEAEALGSFEKKTTVVYKSVYANNDGTITEYSADKLGATYLYALELQNISMTGSYTFEITAFATDANNPENVVNDITVTVSIVEGVIQ